LKIASGTSLAAAMDGLLQIPRWRITSVVLAAILLAMPLTAGDRHVYAALSFPQIAILTCMGLAAGWIALDRMAAFHVSMAGMVLIVLALAVGCWFAGRLDPFRGFGYSRGVGTILAVSIVFGGLVRGATDGRRSAASLVALASAMSWLAYDIPRLRFQPLRDIHLYLGAGSTAVDGASPYLAAPITSIAVLDRLPFVYPPITIPLFEVLASIPRPLADAIWTAGSIVAVLAAFWLLGVRGRWLLVLLAWPAPAVGIAVGNVASFTFLLYVAGFRVGAFLILSGSFKLQSTIPALWLVRERRWREIAAGVGIIAVLAVAAVPLVGLQAWVDWFNGLRYFQESVSAFPSIGGLNLARWMGSPVALAATVVAIGFALLGRGRNGLARFGFASIVASPTLSLHGLSPLLAGALILGPELLWFFLGLGPWYGHQSAWLSIALVGSALLIARGDDLRLPIDLSPSRADVHPAGRTGQVWPDRP